MHAQVHKANYTMMPLRDHVKNLHSYAHTYSCFKKEKDIVAPPHMPGGDVKVAKQVGQGGKGDGGHGVQVELPFKMQQRTWCFFNLWDVAGSTDP